MASYTWKGVSGDWKTATDWTPAGGPPKSTDSATINGSATDTITVDTADVANSLTLSDANATLTDSSGSLTIGGTLAMSNGTLNDEAALTVGALTLSGGALTVSGQLTLNGTLSQTGGTLTLQGGTISGGTIDSTAGTLAFTSSGGTLSGVTFEGPLNLTESSESVQLASGTTVVGSSGSGPGTINDTGEASQLFFDNTQTLNNATINLGNTSDYSFLYENDTTGAGTVLTLGSGVVINANYGYISTGNDSGDGIVNQGAIKQSGTTAYLQVNGNSLTNSGTIIGASSGGSLTIDTSTFTNSGTIDISNRETATIEPTDFSNAATGVIAVGADSTLYLTPGGSWSNLGSITLASGSSLYLGGSFTLAGLGSLSNSGGTVYIQGTFDNTGTLNGSSGLGQAVLDGGTIQGGTVTSAGVTFTSSGGTLSGVTFEGPLNLTESSESVQLASGTTVVGSSGSGPGTINDTGEASQLFFDNTQTLNNATINLGNTSDYSFLYENDTTGAGTVLTLGSGVVINANYGYISTGNDSGDGIVNQGAIKQSGTTAYLQVNGNSLTNSGTIIGASSGGSLTIDTSTFTNSGTIDISNRETATIEPTDFSNAATGVIAVGADSTLYLTPGGSWSNLGSITLASGSSLYLGGSFTLAGLGSLSNSGGTVYIQGTFNNTGGTLNGSSGLGQAVLDDGTVQGGTVTSAGVTFTSSGGTLSGVTFEGPLNLTAGYNPSVQLASGTTVVGSSGSGPGTINDTGEYSDLYFDNAQTVSNVTINLGNTSGYTGYLNEYDTTGAGTVLTLASSVTIDESGDAQIDTGSDYGTGAGDGIVNQGNIKQSGTSSSLQITGNSLTNSGTITGASSDGALTINTTTFTNSGAIDVADGDTVTIESTTFTNLPAHTLTAGTYEAQAGSTIEIYSADTITTDDATIILSGAGSVFETYNTSTGVKSTVDTTLRTIGASGELELLASRNWTTAGAAITNDGIIQLGGGTLTATASGASLTDAAGSTLLGFGTVTATTFANSGTIEASGGTLTLTDAVSGTGDLEIAAGATLVIAATAATTNAATFSGAGATLTLDHTGNLSGAIGGVGIDDIFDLVGVTANGASVNGSNQLVVTESGTTVDTLQLSGSNSGFYFLAQTVSGGTDIVALTIPATVADYEAYTSLYNEIPGGFSILDTAANISNALNSLNGSNINAITISDNNAITVNVAELTSDATAIGKLADAGGGAYQLAVTDTASDISGGLATLQTYAAAGHIASITVSDNNAVGVDVAELTSDATAIGKLADASGGAYQLAVTDTAADISSGLPTLQSDAAAGHIASITISDNSAVGVDVAELTSDATAISKLADAGGSPYQLAVTDTAADISGGLPTLQTYAAAGHIASITISDNNAVGVDVAELTSDATAIGKLADAGGGAYQLAVTDTAADISGGLPTLQSDAAAGHIASIIISDDNAVGVDVAELTSDATAIGKLANANSSPYQLAVTDTASDISGGLPTLQTYAAAGNIASITISDNKAVSLTVADLTSDSAAIGKLADANGSSYQLAVTDTLPDIVGDLSALNGNSHISLLDATSGAATMNGGATVAAAAFTLAGSTTALTLAEILAYSGSFSATASATVSISTGDSLTLTGTDAFSSATVDGAGALDANGTTSVALLTIGGTTTFSDGGTLTESGGSVTLGDSSGHVAKLTIASTGTWDILDTSGIARGSSLSSAITNRGLFEKTGGTGASVITPKTTNDGTVLVSAGTLELKGAVTGTGTDTISGAATLEFGAGVSTAATLGDQDTGFTGGGTLHLLAPKTFYGEISDFGAGDTVELLGSWAFSGISQTGGVTTLTLASGSTTHGFEFAGDYAQSNFSIASGTTTKIGYA